MQESMKAAGQRKECLIVCTDLHCTYCGKRPRGIVLFFLIIRKETLSFSCREEKTSPYFAATFIPTCWMGFRVTLRSTQMPLISSLFFFFCAQTSFPPQPNPTPTPTPTPPPFPFVTITLPESEKMKLWLHFWRKTCVFEHCCYWTKRKKVWGCPFFLPFAGEFNS